MNLNFNNLAEELKNEVVKEFEKNSEKYIQEEGNLNEESLLDTAIENMVEALKENVESELEVKFIELSEEALIDTVMEVFDFDVMVKIEEDAKGIHREEELYNKDKLGYYGMKESDFLSTPSH